MTGQSQPVDDDHKSIIIDPEDAQIEGSSKKRSAMRNLRKRVTKNSTRKVTRKKVENKGVKKIKTPRRSTRKVHMQKITNEEELKKIPDKKKAHHPHHNKNGILRKKHGNKTRKNVRFNLETSGVQTTVFPTAKRLKMKNKTAKASHNHHKHKNRTKKQNFKIRFQENPEDDDTVVDKSQQDLIANLKDNLKEVNKALMEDIDIRRI